jgi:hypothetical protein
VCRAFAGGMIGLLWMLWGLVVTQSSSLVSFAIATPIFAMAFTLVSLCAVRGSNLNAEASDEE